MFASLHTSSVALDRVQRRGGKGIFARISAAFELAAQRRQLAALDDALLEDIGLSRGDARREAARAPWDVPRHWLS